MQTIKEAITEIINFVLGLIFIGIFVIGCIGTYKLISNSNISMPNIEMPSFEIFKKTEYLTGDNLAKIDPVTARTKFGRDMINWFDNQNGKSFCVPKMNKEELEQAIALLSVDMIVNSDSIAENMIKGGIPKLGTQQEKIAFVAQKAIANHYPCK